MGYGLEAALVVLVLGGAGVDPRTGQLQTQRFALQGEAGGGIWVLDQVAERAPRVIDVVFGQPVPRPRSGSGGEPICSRFVAPGGGAPIRPRVLGGAGAFAGGTYSGQ